MSRPTAAWHQVQDRSFGAAARTRVLCHQTMYRLMVMTEPPPPWSEVAAKVIAGLAARGATEAA